MRVRGLVEYDGGAFRGWQRQTQARSVQQALEEAITEVTGDGAAEVVGAGRTDAGVHATGQAMHFDTGWNRTLGELQRAMNAVLPADVAVRGLEVAPVGFHARHSAVARAYRYTVWATPVRSPLARRAALHVPWPLDVAAMAAAARPLVGEHDFGAFGRPMSPEGSTVRRMERCDVVADGPRITFELEANAFLRHQVRRTVGSLLEVGRGALEADAVGRALARLPAAPVPPRVPPHGLDLHAVRYPPDDDWNRPGGRVAGS